MPQISQILETYASQFFWLLIVFGLIYFTIGHGMLPKIEASMDARDRKIADDLAAAERARAEADNLGDSGAADLTAARTEAQAKSSAAKAKAAKAAAVGKLTKTLCTPAQGTSRRRTTQSAFKVRRFNVSMEL
jgi:F-type H+-transporting ATPase subunit b